MDRKTNVMNQNNKNVSKLVLFAIIIVIAGFYWLVLRPENIRKECYKKASEESIQVYSYEDEPNTDKRGVLQERYIDKWYKNCLHEKGLEN